MRYSIQILREHLSDLECILTGDYPESILDIVRKTLTT